MADEATMNVCVVGCLHGELDALYAALADLERETGRKVDLVLCCGDFQSVRDEADLASVAVPDKHRKLMDFPRYFSGERVAPVPTLFVGGNHEASALLAGLPHGGWVAHNIFFLGHAGVVSFGGLRIAGLSGIYKSGDAPRGHHERPPFSASTLRSVYHARDVDAWLLEHLADGAPLDVFLSHDWPGGVAAHGDTAQLLRRKAHLGDDVRSGRLGSPALARLLATLRPRHWFAAHLHCQFAALVRHDGGAVTRFLALDKPGPGRRWLQLLSVARTGPLRVQMDTHWAAVLAARLPAGYAGAGTVALGPVVRVAARGGAEWPPEGWREGAAQTGRVRAALGLDPYPGLPGGDPAEQPEGGDARKRSRADDPNAIELDDM